MSLFLRKEKEHKDKRFGPDIFWSGGGLPREGRLVCPSKPKESKTLWRDVRGIWPGYPGVHEKFENKRSALLEVWMRQGLFRRKSAILLRGNVVRQPVQPKCAATVLVERSGRLVHLAVFQHQRGRAMAKQCSQFSLSLLRDRLWGLLDVHVEQRSEQELLIMTTIVQVALAKLCARSVQHRVDRMKTDTCHTLISDTSTGQNSAKHHLSKNYYIAAPFVGQ